MSKQKSKFKGIFKGAAIGFAFVMCASFFPAHAIASAVDMVGKDNILLNTIKVDGQSNSMTVKKGESVTIPEGVYEYENAGVKATHTIGQTSTDGIESRVDVYYKATGDKLDVKDNKFTADRVGRYTITYTVKHGDNTYSYDFVVRSEVGEATFEFASNSDKIIPTVYDTKLTDKNIELPLPSVKSGDDELISAEVGNFTLNKEGNQKDFVLVSLANVSKDSEGNDLIKINPTKVDEEVVGYHLSASDLKKAELAGQDITVIYSYYQIAENGSIVFVDSTSRTFSISKAKGYYFMTSSDNAEQGYELETSWSSSISDISAVVGVERELPKITAKTKSTNSPSNETIEISYDIQIFRKNSSGKWEEITGDDKKAVMPEFGTFKADAKGSYKFVYTVNDFYGYGDKISETKRSFEISNVKDTRAANVYVYDAGLIDDEGNQIAYDEEKNSYTSALNMLKSQSGNRNIVMYAVGGTDNMIDKDDLTLRRTILDNTGITMFNIDEKLYHNYNLIFAPGLSQGAGDNASVYKQIVDDNYQIMKQMRFENKDITSESAIKAFLKEHNYLLVTTDEDKATELVSDFDATNEEKVKELIATGYAYVKPSNSKRTTFTDGTYTFVYGAKDEDNTETTTRQTMVISEGYTDASVPTLNFTNSLQVTYLTSDTIEFNVATATDSSSQDTRLETVTAYRFLNDKNETVTNSQTTSVLKYLATNVGTGVSSKWYGEVGKVYNEEGWYIDDTKSTYTINLASRPQNAKYVEILAYAIDDYGNAGFYNRIITIAEVNDTKMPEIFRAVNVPDGKVIDAPKEVTLPTLYFTDDNVDYMSAQVNVYKIVDGEKVSMQVSNVQTEFNTLQETFMVKAGTFRASTDGEYQVAVTVTDAGNHSVTTYFHYTAKGGSVLVQPEISNITSETIELDAGKAYYLVPPTISVLDNNNYGYIGISDDDSRTATNYTTTIVSATDDYELTKYYFTGSKSGVFKLQYKVYLMQYSKDSSVYAESATLNKVYLENGKLKYKTNNGEYFVFISENADGQYVLDANTSLQGDGTTIGSTDLTNLQKIVNVYTILSKVQTINVGGIDMNITIDDNIYSKAYTQLGEEVPIVKPSNIEYNAPGYQTNTKDSTVTITRTIGNTTTTLATLNFADWEKDVPTGSDDVKLNDKEEVILALNDNGRYTIKYSVQAMDKNGLNVGSPKTVEYTIKNGDVVGPTIELAKNLVNAKYKLGDTLSLNMAGLTVSDNVTTDVNDLLSNMTVKIRNNDQDDSYTTLTNTGDAENNEYVYTHKLESAGSYTLTITIKDKAGNESSQSVSFEVTTDDKKEVNVKEVMGGVLIGLSVAILAGVVIYFVVSKVKLDKKEKKYKDK